MLDNVSRGSNRVRQYNIKKLYDLIRKNEGISRAELTKLINLTPTSVSKIISLLLADGLVSENGVITDGSVGRRAIQLSIVPDRVLTIAVSVDVGRISGAVVNIAGSIQRQTERVLPEQFSFDVGIDAIYYIIKELYDGLDDTTRENLVGIGISVPGRIDKNRGIVVLSPQLGWNDCFLISRLRERFKDDVPIYLENNVKAEAEAECIFGTAGNKHSAVVVDIGSGLGAAYICNGRVQGGFHDSMGEIGHILVGSNGARCSCGRYGCLRTHIAISSIEERTGISIEKAVSSARHGDGPCRMILDEAVKYLGMWLANLINLYDPEAIYIGGGILCAWPEFFGRVRDEYKKYMWKALEGEKYEILETTMSAVNSPLVSASAITFYRYLLTEVQISDN